MDRSTVAAILYTVRDHCQSADDLRASLEKIAHIGYRSIQFSGVPADVISPAELRRTVDDLGLSICATHEPPPTLLQEPQRSVDRLKELGVTYAAYPYPQDVDFTDAARVQAWIDHLEAAAQCFRKHDLVLCYHNHHHEFMRLEGRTLYERLLTDTSIGFEMDTHWVQAGGASPAEWAERLGAAGRLHLLHLKDFRIAPGPVAQFAELGQGNLNFAPILDAAERHNCAYYIVEQDETYGRDPFEALAESFAYLDKHFIR